VPNGGCVKEGPGGKQNFHPCWALTKTPSPWYQ
jgi:hypothetical protein